MKEAPRQKLVFLILFLIGGIGLLAMGITLKRKSTPHIRTISSDTQTLYSTSTELVIPPQSPTPVPVATDRVQEPSRFTCTNQLQSEWSVYSNAEIGFEIRYPSFVCEADFKRTIHHAFYEHEQSKGFYLFHLSGGGELPFFLMTVEKSTTTPEAEYQRWSRRNSTIDYLFNKVEKSQSFLLNGAPAFLVVTSWRDDSHSMSAETYVKIGDFMFYSDISHESPASPDFYKNTRGWEILSTLRHFARIGASVSQ